MLAIVIPYYNLDFFEKCLESLDGQINKRFNVYIGNDASPKDPEPIINTFKSKLNITYKKFPDNIGGYSLPKQWDRCIQMTNNEEWIMILGDDDLLGKCVVKDFYANYNAFAERSNVVRFASQVIGEEGTIKSPIYRHPEWETATDSFYRWLKGKTRSSLSEHVFRKKTYEKHGFKKYPIGWHSDDMAWLDFPDQKDIYSINNSTIFIRHSGRNLTTITDNINLKEKASIKFHEDLVKEKLSLFSVHQKREILIKYEVFKKGRNIMNFKEWIILAKLYFRHTNLIHVLKLIRRFFIYQVQ